MNPFVANHKSSAVRSPDRAIGYREIAREIQEWISDGRLKPGDRLPPELKLSRQFAVTRLTLRRALDVLETRALIYRACRVGTFVSDRALLPPVVSPMSQSLRQVMQRTRGYSITFLGWSKAWPTQDVRAALRTGRDQSVYEFRFLRSHNDEPLGFFIYRVPEYVVHRMGLTEYPENFHLRSTLISFGFESKRIIQKIGAQLADSKIAKVLLLPDNSVVVRFRLTHYDGRGRPFLYATTYFRSEDYEYAIEFVDNSKMKNLYDI